MGMRNLDGRDNLRRSGKNLTEGSASKKFDPNTVSFGSKYEKRFAHYASDGHRLPFWALRNDHIWTSRNGNPLKKRSSRKKNGKSSVYQHDIDFVFANGKNVIFVDVKGYSAGKFYWNMFPFDDFRVRAGTSIKTDKNGKEVALSKSMISAINNYKEVLPEANIKSILAFVPTAKSIRSYGDIAPRESLPGNVMFLRAPGGIKSYNMEEAFREINKHIGTEEKQVPRRIRDVFDSNAMK